MRVFRSNLAHKCLGSRPHWRPSKNTTASTRMTSAWPPANWNSACASYTMWLRNIARSANPVRNLLMSILINTDTRLLVQGITGREGEFHTRQMLDYGTQVVAGTSPGKGGTRAADERVPVF